MTVLVLSEYLKGERIMELIPKNILLQYNEDTLQVLRKQYNLENPLRINEAIDILEVWLQKQEHFVIKKLSRDYLERAIILGKGSVEKVKKKLDTLFSLRTSLPTYFQPFDIEQCRNSEVLIDTLVPKMTPDHYRVYILKVIGENFDFSFINYFRSYLSMCEYMHTYDYCNGVIIILDYTETSVTTLAKVLDVNDTTRVLKIFEEGYGVRLKGMHVLTPSKFVNLIVTLLKQAFSAKLGERIYVHKGIDTVHQIIPKDILPRDYGGEEKCMKDLHVDHINALCSDEFTQHLNKMRSACTNEVLRLKDNHDNDIMGVSGTFRSLHLD